jgi:hypothetical protein
MEHKKGAQILTHGRKCRQGAKNGFDDWRLRILTEMKSSHEDCQLVSALARGLKTRQNNLKQVRLTPFVAFWIRV